MNDFKKNIIVFLYLILAIFASQNCNAQALGNVPLGANCKANITIMTPATANVDPITLQFGNLLKGVEMNAAGNINQEGSYIICNNTNDALQSCLYGSTSGQETFQLTPDYTAATPNPKVPALDSSGNSITVNGNQVYCPLTRADVVTDDIMAVFTYNGTQYNIKPTVSGDVINVIPGNFGIGGFRAIKVGTPLTGESVCLAIQGPQGYVYVGCKSPPIPNTPSGNTACTAGASSHSKAFFSVSGRIIECVQDLFATVFTTNSMSGCTNPPCTTIFQNFQTGMQNIVQAALVLYVIIFGINIALSSEVPKKSEILIGLFKIILVTYFSVGLTFDGSNSSGIVDYVYPLLKAAMNSFAQYVLGAVPGFCQYDPTTYPTDNGVNYSYLALWDSLDCRVGYYLGFYSIFTPNANGIYGILSLIFPLVFAMKFLFIAFMLCMGIFILSIVIYFVHVYILALLGLTMMAYLAPIFVPCALFEKTKDHFDAWKSLLISYTLQPTILTGFLAIMLAVFDQIVFGTCTFDMQTVGNYAYWIVSPNPSTDPACYNSFGYQLGSTSPTSVNLLFFSVSIFDPDMAGPLFSGLVKAMIFAFIFFFFSESLGEFAAELSGGNSLSDMAISPTKVMKEASGKMYQKIFEKVKPKGPEGVDVKDTNSKDNNSKDNNAKDNNAENK
jgi:type IV secretion system protein VirB6